MCSHLQVHFMYLLNVADLRFISKRTKNGLVQVALLIDYHIQKFSYSLESIA